MPKTTILISLDYYNFTFFSSWGLPQEVLEDIKTYLDEKLISLIMQNIDIVLKLFPEPLTKPTFVLRRYLGEALCLTVPGIWPSCVLYMGHDDG